MATRRRKSPSRSARTAKKAAAKERTAPGGVFEIEVTLRETAPPVSRRILVPGGLSLGQLHIVLQIAMGWQECHLHQVHVGDTDYSDPEFGLGEDGGEEVGDEFGISVARAFEDGDGHLVYEYDSGDCWEHDLRVVKVHSPEEAPATGPLCIAGAGACPPEDVGGTPGYESFLEVMADPDHPEHGDMVSWVGGAFDPGKFDMADVNRELKRLR